MTQPKALYLADVLENKAINDSGTALELAAAAELRRLHAENEALRVDAERYRYLRNRYPSDVLDKTGLEAGAWIDCEDINGTLVLLTGEHADETIDAERSKT